MTYERSGASYLVEANIYKGSELNERTSTWSYSPYSKYVVVFWGDGATVIEMDSSYCTGEYLPCDGLDQEGRPWSVNLDPYFCG